MRIDIFEEKCCGAGQCVLVAPDVFDQREEDGIVVLLDTAPGDDRLPSVHEAAQLCPAAAIVVREN